MKAMKSRVWLTGLLAAVTACEEDIIVISSGRDMASSEALDGGADLGTRAPDVGIGGTMDLGAGDAGLEDLGVADQGQPPSLTEVSLDGSNCTFGYRTSPVGSFHALRLTVPEYPFEVSRVSYTAHVNGGETPPCGWKGLTRLSVFVSDAVTPDALSAEPDFSSELVEPSNTFRSDPIHVDFSPPVVVTQGQSVWVVIRGEPWTEEGVGCLRACEVSSADATRAWRSFGLEENSEWQLLRDSVSGFDDAYRISVAGRAID
jgi:hypothetical protein